MFFFHLTVIVWGWQGDKNINKVPMEEKGDDILYIGFNQDFSCFSMGTERGFKILNTYPYKDTFKRGRLRSLIRI